MKNMFGFLLPVFLLLMTAVSCSKDKDTDDTPNEETAKATLQQSWTLVSVKAYGDRGFTYDSGYGYYSQGGETYEFRNNGKLYAVTSFGRDTADYQLLSNDTTMLIYQYANGVRPSIPDTLYIRTLTNTALILATMNPSGDWGKFTFKKD